MGTVIQLKKQINNSYLDLKNSVEDKLILVEEKIKNKLSREVDLVQKMSDYHIKTGGKKLRRQTTKSDGFLKMRSIQLKSLLTMVLCQMTTQRKICQNSWLQRLLRAFLKARQPLLVSIGMFLKNHSGETLIRVCSINLKNRLMTKDGRRKNSGKK